MAGSDAGARLLRAIDEYEEAYRGDPKYRRALINLDDFRSAAQSLNISTDDDSPGRDAARAVASRENAKTPEQKQDEFDTGPRDYQTAAKEAHARFSDSESTPSDS